MDAKELAKKLDDDLNQVRLNIINIGKKYGAISPSVFYLYIAMIDADLMALLKTTETYIPEGVAEMQEVAAEYGADQYSTFLKISDLVKQIFGK